MSDEQLQFSPEGRFRVLMVSDFHAGEQFDPKLKTGLEALLEHTSPDFVMIGGDQCLGRDTLDGLRDYMSDIIEPILNRDLPWGAIFGNHDREMGHKLEDEQKAYNEIDGCMSSAGPRELTGIGNFHIPVYSASGRLAYELWGLDSSIYQRSYPEMFGWEEEYPIALPDHFNDCGTDGTPLFDQVVWYWNESRALETKFGAKIPGIMFTHVPIQEYLNILRNPEECGARGSSRERTCAPEINDGLFLAALQRGDIRGFFFGHDHHIDIQGEYCGVTMACDAALGYNMSAHDDLRGGRVIDLWEDGRLETFNVKLMDIMGKDCMRDPGYFEGGCPYFIRKL